MAGEEGVHGGGSASCSSRGGGKGGRGGPRLSRRSTEGRGRGDPRLRRATTRVPQEKGGRPLPPGTNIARTCRQQVLNIVPKLVQKRAAAQTGTLLGLETLALLLAEWHTHL